MEGLTLRHQRKSYTSKENRHDFDLCERHSAESYMTRPLGLISLCQGALRYSRWRRCRWPYRENGRSVKHCSQQYSEADGIMHLRFSPSCSNLAPLSHDASNARLFDNEPHSDVIQGTTMLLVLERGIYGLSMMG